MLRFVFFCRIILTSLGYLRKIFNFIIQFGHTIFFLRSFRIVQKKFRDLEEIGSALWEISGETKMYSIIIYLYYNRHLKTKN